ncbi:hypothetical protein [Microbacterium sp.]|uniref:hypothetical protein n=1 Tax=Microbacterium sp. TaxID=51671 RepID=UPI0039E2F726
MDSLALLERTLVRVDAVRAELAGIRRLAAALADQTAWRSSGADAFRAAVGAWIEQLDQACAQLELLRDDLDIARARSMLVAVGG